MAKREEEDSLVTLWRDARRPLNWRSWRLCSAEEQAKLGAVLMVELQGIERLAGAGDVFMWRHAHRELLELKAASGHERRRDDGGESAN